MGPREFENRKIIVFGASSGIGRACAIQLGEQGARVVLVGRNHERLAETASHIPEDRRIILLCDVSDFDAAQAAVKEAVKWDGAKLDGGVFSAGAGLIRPVISAREEDLLALFRVNFFSFAAVLKLFASRRISNCGASFVGISSCAAMLPDKGQGIYGATKASMNAYAAAAAQELASRGIRVNTVCPDMVDTPMGGAGLRRLSAARMQERFPLGGLVPEDIADTVLYLLSDFSRKITGQAISVTAGSIGGGDQVAF